MKGKKPFITRLSEFAKTQKGGVITYVLFIASQFLTSIDYWPSYVAGGATVLLLAWTFVTFKKL